jgi:hypothetical protein
MTELQLQSKCFQWAWNEYPETRRLLFHVPNGGKRSKREAMNLKASGVVAGIPDMPFLWKGRLYAFEFKVDRNGLSDDQEETFIRWSEHGATCCEVRDVEGFKSIFQTIINKQS